MGAKFVPVCEWLAAKSGRESRTRWLPLWMHLEDTASVMERLVRCWLPSSFAGAAHLSRGELMQAAVLAGYWHDIGKATSLFQSRIIMASEPPPAACESAIHSRANMPGVRERLSSLGLPLYDPNLFLNARST